MFCYSIFGYATNKNIDSVIKFDLIQNVFIYILQYLINANSGNTYSNLLTQSCIFSISKLSFFAHQIFLWLLLTSRFLFSRKNVTEIAIHRKWFSYTTIIQILYLWSFIRLFCIEKLILNINAIRIRFS